MLLSWLVRTGFAALVFAVPGALSAQSIHKCVHPKTGSVAYSSEPCPSTDAEWRQSFEGTGDVNDRDRMTASEARARIAADQYRLDNARRAERARHAVPHMTHVPSTIGRCEAAKRTRDANLEATRPRRGSHSVESLRSWDRYVAAACN